MIFVSEKRAPRGNLYKRDSGLSDDPWTPKYASEIRPGVGMPSPSSGGGNSPLGSTPGGTEVPYPEGVVKPGTTAENQLASTTGNKAKSVSWAPLMEVQLPSGDVLRPPLQSKNNLLSSPPPGREGYLAKQQAQQQAQQQAKSFGSKVKAFFGKLGKVMFRPRFRRSGRTVDTRA